MSSPTSQSPESAAPDLIVPAEDWFHQEVHVHDRQLRAYLHGAFPHVPDLEDVVQESYLRIWRRHAVRPIATAKAFLFTIARRLVIDRIRHDRVSCTEAVEDLSTLAVYDDGRSAADAVSRAEMVQLLVEAIDGLPGRCRDVVILRKLKLLSARETALKLGIKEHTVEMQLLRANSRIRAFLAARGVTSTLGRDS